MVIRDVDADVLGVAEAESRIALKSFSTILLGAVAEGIERQAQAASGARRQDRQTPAKGGRATIHAASDPAAIYADIDL